MATKLADLQRRPEKTKPEWEAKKNAWQAEKRRLSTAQTKAAGEKATADRQAAAVESEAASLATKKEKLAARLGKLRVDLDKLGSEHSEGSDSKERRRAEREASEKHRQSLEREYVEAIQQLEARIKEYTVHTQSNLAQCYALAESALQAPPADGTVLHPGNRERSSSLFSDGSVITNLSEVGHPGPGPAAVGMMLGGRLGESEAR